MKRKATYSITLNCARSKERRENDEPERGMWGGEMEFFLSCVGWSVGFSNVWRFPYMAYANGGGAFLFPYIILSVLVGKPLYFLELAMGQFCSRGPLDVWKCFPLAKGIGGAMVTVSFLMSVNYNVMMAYSIIFLRYSFESILPWTGCFESWGADPNVCYVRKNQTLCSRVMNGRIQNKSLETNYWIQKNNCTNATEMAAQHFWKRHVLDISSGVDDMGIIKWDLAVCLVIAWCIIYLCLAKGVKTAGKALYFTSTIPYLCMVTLLIYGLTLDGAMVGLKYLFVPDWRKAIDIDVWMDAATQLFYSLGLSWGGLIMCGSYNHFHSKVHKYALIVSIVDFVTSIAAATILFSVLGQMAKESGLKMEEVIGEEEDLIFVAYPEALSLLPIPQLWLFVFFFMLLLLGIDSEFLLLETSATCLYDAFPETRRHKPLVSFCLCIFGCFVGLPCVMQGGIYVFRIINHYGGSFTLLFIAIFELTAIMWGYGIKRVCNDFEMMLGFKMNYYFQASWQVVSPLLLSFIFIYGMLRHEAITYEGKEYPEWAIGVGWLLAMLSVSQIPLWAIFMLIRHRNNLHKVILPTSDWGPADPVARKKWLQMNNLETERKEMAVNKVHSPSMNINESEV